MQERLGGAVPKVQGFGRRRLPRCWGCGGEHYSSECPRMKGRGRKGINGVDGQGETSKDESVELGGGKGEVSSNEWNYGDEIDYRKLELRCGP